VTPNELHLEYELRAFKRDHSAACKGLESYELGVAGLLAMLEQMPRGRSLDRDTVYMQLDALRALAREKQALERAHLDEFYRKNPLPQATE